ncbi:MAG: hypothetical protein PHV17_01435 [Candidatus Omnitrophica bacterium]|nr:hypothetical protein [Candidatus Omnitrophota bacterium]
MDLKQEITKLVDLQEIDLKIYQLDQKKSVEIPAKIDKLNKEFELQTQALNDAQDLFKDAHLKKKDAELNLAQKEEALLKGQGQLYKLKTNKEYQAKLTEIAALKADVSVLEENVLKSMETISLAEAKIASEKQSLSEKEKKSKEEISLLTSEIKECEISQKVLEDKRLGLSRDVDPKILATYEKLVKTRSGLAIAKVVNNSCGACYMSVTAQVINELKMYKDLVMCATCMRILYIDENQSL